MVNNFESYTGLPCEEGVCKDCGSAVMCDDAIKSNHKGKLNADYWIYCSNPSCKNHIGKICGDQEIDTVKFLKTEYSNEV